MRIRVLCKSATAALQFGMLARGLARPYAISVPCIESVRRRGASVPRALVAVVRSCYVLRKCCRGDQCDANSDGMG